MRILKIILPLIVLIAVNLAARAQYEEVVKYNLTTRCIPEDASSGFPATNRYEVGESIHLNASPKHGFIFQRWEDESGIEMSMSSELDYIMPAHDVILYAVFEFSPESLLEPIQPKFLLSLKSNPPEGSSSLSGAGEHISGAPVDVSASSAAHYLFDNWTDEQGNVVSEEINFSYTMPNRHTALTANFHYDFDTDDLEEPSVPTIGVVSECKIIREDLTHISIECATQGSSIYYTLDGTDPTIISPLYNGLLFLTGNVTVKAFAVKFGMQDSPIAEYIVNDFKCTEVNFSYNGRYLKISTSEPDAIILYSTDGSDPSNGTEYSGEFDVKSLCNVRAVAVKDLFLNSEIRELAINYYADESHAETAEGGLLQSAFAWSGPELPAAMEEFSVSGTLNDDDYSFLKSMEGLRHLNIEKVAAARIPDNAFRGSRLVSISMPADISEYGDSILSDCDRLSGVIWNSKKMDLESRLVDGVSNPNVLFYVSSEVNVENQGDRNIIVDDVASSVILHDEYPFDVAREFMAEKISFTRNFDMETPINGSSGWESIVLPFSPDSIVHERAGRIVPFKAWEEDEFADFKPFWLYRSNSSGWEEVESMEACVPYIISMPNNEAYVRDFNIAGNVSFVASHVMLTPESASPEVTPWLDGTQFIGTFMPVEETGVRSLNVNGEDDRTPGSAFVEEASTKPFGAYIAGAQRQYMPVFESSGASLIPSLGSDGLKVNSPAPGTLKISSNCRRKISLTTITGVNLRTVLLSAGETVIIEGLTRDIYIVGGIKVTVR